MRTRENKIAAWSGRVGEDVVRLSISSARAVVIGSLLVPVWVVMFMLGHNTSWALITASGLALVGAVVLLRGILLMRREFALMSERFEMRVSFLNSPTLRERSFTVWCERYGVDATTGLPLSEDDADSGPSAVGSS